MSDKLNPRPRPTTSSGDKDEHLAAMTVGYTPVSSPVSASPRPYPVLPRLHRDHTGYQSIPEHDPNDPPRRDPHSNFYSRSRSSSSSNSDFNAHSNTRCKHLVPTRRAPSSSGSSVTEDDGEHGNHCDATDALQFLVAVAFFPVTLLW